MSKGNHFQWPQMNGASKASPKGLSIPLSNQAYYRIRDRILRGELIPGDALSARRLAAEFGMSLLPISQALRQLENERLLESRPRAGTRVRIPGPEEIRGQCIVREALEAQSARLCAVHATVRERLQLLRLAEQLDTLYDRFGPGGDTDLQYAVHTLHFELHMRIAEYARCQELKDAIEKNQVLVYNWFFDLVANRRTLPPRFHFKLLESVTSSDPRVADQAMRAHVQYGVPESIGESTPPAARDWRLRRSQGNGDNGRQATIKIRPAASIK